MITFAFSFSSAKSISCEEKEKARSQETQIYLADEHITSPISRHNSSSMCRKEDLSIAAAGCNFVRKDAWKFTLPFGTLNDWKKLERKEGGRDSLYRKFGFVRSPSPNGDLPMGITLAPNGKDLHFNCFLCHGGSVNGRPFEGAANAELKIDELFKKFNKNALVDAYLFAVGSFNVPNHPQANRGADSTKLALELRNNEEGNVGLSSVTKYLWNQRSQQRNRPAIPNYAPPWWNAAPGLRKSAFITGQFNLGASHMGVMAMLTTLSKDELKALNPDFEKVVACVQSTPVPKKMFKTDPNLVKEGKLIFSGKKFANQDCNCMNCHGKTEMDARWDYPEKQVPLDYVKTDPEFNKNFGPDYRRRLAAFVKEIDPCSEFIDSPNEYIVSPPLVALFTKSGLLHNRSVPTLHDLLCVKENDRPKKWKLKADANVYDRNSVDRAAADSDTTYNTTLIGSSNQGHNFCTTELSSDETSCRSLIEYMKTLGP